MTTRLNLAGRTGWDVSGLSGAVQRRRVAEMHLRRPRRAIGAFREMGRTASTRSNQLDEQAISRSPPSMKKEPAIYRLADPEPVFDAIANKRYRLSRGGRRA